MGDPGYKKTAGGYIPGVFLRLTSGERLQDLCDLKHLKKEILDNLCLILNSCSRPGPDELENDPELVYSVLGFGVGNFCGRVCSESTVSAICEEIRQQVIHFEPRLDPQSVSVGVHNPEGQRKSSLTVGISARIAQQPFTDDEVNCRFVLDLETGIPRLDGQEGAS
jgi:type VI secretion system protein ImpF